jgi:hypothetical protein
LSNELLPMENSKLIELLNVLTLPELKRLESYILSPYFNNSEQITSLFKIIKKHSPDYKNLSKESIFKIIFPGEPYKDKKIRDLLSRMLKLTEDFLGEEEFSKRQMLKTSFSLQQLAAKNMEKHFASKAREADLEIIKEKIVSSDLLFSKYSVFREKREYLSALKGMKKRAGYYEDITTEIDLFTAYAVHNILKYEITILANKKEIKYSHRFKILDSILEFCRHNPMNDYPVIMIFYYMILLSRNHDDMETYLKLKKLIDDSIDYLSESDKLIILVEQFNFTKVQALKGIDFYRKENYRILKQNTDKGIYPTEGRYFADLSYVMIAVTAFQQKDFEWGESFIEKYRDKLHPLKKENVYTYLLGVLNYRKGNYGPALNCLAKVSTDDFDYYWRVKNHQLKIYFETGEYESVLGTADSYKHFLSTARHMPDYEKIRFVNFVNFISRLANARLTGNNNNLLDIKNEIVSFNQENLENKIWLLEQINKMEI